MPQDPSSGAARTILTVCEMLADAGYEVRALATTATERGTKANAADYLKSCGIVPKIERRPRSGPSRPEIRFTHKGVAHCLLETANCAIAEWEKLYGRHFDWLFDDELKRFGPDIVFTYGGSAGDMRRQQRARKAGAKVVFGLFNLGYLVQGAFDHVDSILTPSQFITDRYRAVLGVASTPLPTPVEMADVIAEERDPVFVTIVNPSPEKGLMFIARLLEESALRRPDVAYLVIEARGTAGLLARAGLAGGFDLRRHEGIMVSAPVPKPKDIYAGTSVLLVPSLWEEPSARVTAEALLNGIPAIVSDRGGMAESLNGGGFVLPIPSELTPESRVPPGAETVAPWLELIFRLSDDEGFYAESSARALAAGKMYRREAMAPRYVRFFESLLDPA